MAVPHFRYEWTGIAGHFLDSRKEYSVRSLGKFYHTQCNIDADDPIFNKSMAEAASGLPGNIANQGVLDAIELYSKKFANECNTQTVEDMGDFARSLGITLPTKVGNAFNTHKAKTIVDVATQLRVSVPGSPIALELGAILGTVQDILFYDYEGSNKYLELVADHTREALTDLENRLP